jgi:hypothetical protein
MSSIPRSGSSSSACCGDRPDASKSNTSVTRMRSPRTQGRPPHWSGFTVIRSARAAKVHSSVTGYTATQPDAHQDAPQPAETPRRQLAGLVLQTTSRSRIRPPPQVRSIAARSPVPRPAARRDRLVVAVVGVKQVVILRRRVTEVLAVDRHPDGVAPRRRRRGTTKPVMSGATGPQVGCAGCTAADRASDKRGP